MIRVNNFGCLARDLNVIVFSMVIFLPTFITSEEAFNLVEIAILALSKWT